MITLTFTSTRPDTSAPLFWNSNVPEIQELLESTKNILSSTLNIVPVYSESEDTLTGKHTYTFLDEEQKNLAYALVASLERREICITFRNIYCQVNGHSLEESLVDTDTNTEISKYIYC